MTFGKVQVLEYENRNQIAVSPCHATAIDSGPRLAFATRRCRFRVPIPQRGNTSVMMTDRLWINK